MDPQQMGIPDPQDVEKNKAMAILAYIVFFVPLIAARESRFAMFHANQGLVLFLTAVAGYIVCMILSFLLIGLILMPLWMIAMLVLVVIGIINASKGEMKPLPMIGGFTIIK